MPYDDSSARAVAAPEHVSYTVDILRSWLAQKYRHLISPVREDQEVEMRELLELMARKCPADLELLQASELDSLDIMSSGLAFHPATPPHIEAGEAKSKFFVAAVESALLPEA